MLRVSLSGGPRDGEVIYLEAPGRDVAWLVENAAGDLGTCTYRYTSVDLDGGRAKAKFSGIRYRRLKESMQ